MKKNLTAVLTVMSLALPLFIVTSEPPMLPTALGRPYVPRPATAAERAHLQDLLNKRIAAKVARSAATPAAAPQPAESSTLWEFFFGKSTPETALSPRTQLVATKALAQTSSTGSSVHSIPVPVSETPSILSWEYWGWKSEANPHIVSDEKTPLALQSQALLKELEDARIVCANPNLTLSEYIALKKRNEGMEL